jgi:hypothetical protein
MRATALNLSRMPEKRTIAVIGAIHSHCDDGVMAVQLSLHQRRLTVCCGAATMGPLRRM